MLEYSSKKTVVHTDWSKSEREKQIPYANAYIWNLKIKQKKWSWRTSGARQE